MSTPNTAVLICVCVCMCMCLCSLPGRPRCFYSFTSFRPPVAVSRRVAGRSPHYPSTANSSGRPVLLAINSSVDEDFRTNRDFSKRQVPPNRAYWIRNWSLIKVPWFFWGVRCVATGLEITLVHDLWTLKFEF